MSNLSTVKVKTCEDVKSSEFDCVILILESVDDVAVCLKPLVGSLQSAAKIRSKFSTDVHVLECSELPSNRLIVSFTGCLDRDVDDSRRITEAANAGINQAVKIGSVKPLLVLTPLSSSQKLKYDWLEPSAVCLASLLGALHALYVPLEVREFATDPRCMSKKSVRTQKVELLGWFSKNYPNLEHGKLVNIAWSIEEGRRVSRDIGGSDPERMCAKNIVNYLRNELDECVKLEAAEVSPTEYPMAAIVDRGSSDRNRGQIVHLEYAGLNEGDNSDELNLFLVGKGIVYDTGGSDLKVGGRMATMHRDKCGAAAVAGFFKTLSLLKPKNIKVCGLLACVRNSIGNEAYVSDEIVVSRAGIRVRVNNTDAEGRMVMTDLLCEAKEKALKSKNARIVTIATLTGHVGLTYGPDYTAAVCNGPARRMKEDIAYQSAGQLLGEMLEISTLRREDYEAHKTDDDYCDLRNAARPVQGARVRGHQGPAAFMIMASGLDAHLTNSEHPLSYTHLDIAASHGPCPGIPTGTPVVTLVSRYILPQQLDWPKF